jgi:KAP family P-loop domain
MRNDSIRRLGRQAPHIADCATLPAVPLLGRDRTVDTSSQRLAYDGLGHERLARSVLTYLDTLPAGTVIAIEGAWGRGKTDVLARIVRQLRDHRTHAEPVWLNPWQYGTPDLITPIVRELVGRIPPEQRKKSDRLRLAAKTLLRAGNAMIFKTVSVAVPFGQILSAGESAADDAIKELFDGAASAPSDDPDPVAAMAQRFRELVGEYRTLSGTSTQLVVCVDDLDRCLPDHQIAMLEAIHFLTSAHANCAFVIAIDPMLVRQAANTHYKTQGFDSGRYLDKLFDLQIALPALTPATIAPLAYAIVKYDPRFVPAEAFQQSLHGALGVDQDRLVRQIADVTALPELTNPRLLLRILTRVRLLVDELCHAQDDRLAGEQYLLPLVVWLTIAERWPQLRELLQATHHEGWTGNLQLIGQFYGVATMQGYNEREALDALRANANVTARAPHEEQNPDVGRFLFITMLCDDAPVSAAQLMHCEAVLREYGI